ncbi:MAG TPA: hypothetical protein DET40_06770 [Lentisphaeria bacterium]|nr:MAG: hypothetical protein A2X45_07530 [Lentisphaerae bacterium GWF2_50_93]HCE43232.1 hypothetical protein [Lentisphaeria bacterium]
MRRSFLLLALCFVVFFNYTPAWADASADAKPGLTLSQRANKAMDPAENTVRMAEGKALLKCSMQAVDATIDANGLKIRSTSSSEGVGEFSLGIAAVGRAGQLQDLSGEKGQITSEGNIVRLSRTGVTEEFSTSADGVRQDFIVNSRPSGNGPLLLNLELSGAKVSGSGPALLIELASGRKLSYSNLHVTDAAGKTLPAEMSPLASNTIGITVNDTGATYPVRIDPVIGDADWTPINTQIPGTNGDVKAMAYHSGNLYIAGFFTAVKNVPANFIAKWDGANWSGLSSGMNGRVNAITFDSLGNLYAGGGFTTAGGVSATRIAKWNGTAWSALGWGMNNEVYALVCDSSDNLYAAGFFSYAGGVAANRVAKWNGTAWSALGSGMDYGIMALACDSSDIIYAAGGFTSAGGVPANRIAKWNGTAWSTLGSGMNNTVNCLALDSSDNLFAGGDFITAGGVTVNRVARWSGSAWSALDSGTSGSVYSLAFDSSGNLCAGGYFSTAGGVDPANNVAICSNPNTSPVWSALGTGINNNVYALAGDPSGNIYAGGRFITAGGGSANNIAMWNGSWNAFGTGMNNISSSLYENVSVMACDSSGNVYVTGKFTMAGIVPASRIAKWDGANWSALGTGLDEYSWISVMACDSLGRLYVGGSFSTIGGVPANNIAMWNGAWNAIGTGTNSSGSVYSLAFDASDNLYLGGDFSTAGGVAVNRIAKCTTPSGSPTWSALGSGTSDRVRSLVFHDASTLYAGGDFITAGGVTVNRIAKWNGTNWSALGSGMSSGLVNSMACDPTTGNLYTAGSFQKAGGVSVYALAKWTAATSTWSALGSGISYPYTSDPVVAVKCDSLGNLYAAGSFETAGGIPANCIAKWNGSAWSALGSGTNNKIYAMAFDPVGDNLYVGGGFTTAGNQFSAYVATYAVSPNPPADLTIAKIGDGTTTPAVGKTSVTTGKSIVINAIPTAGNDFTGWTVSGPEAVVADIGAASTTVTLSGNATVTANFAISVKTITVSAGANGSIAPAGPAVSVNYYGSKSFTITPSANYHVADVEVDGTSVGAVTSYKFTNVKADHAIDATFAINTNTVTFVEGANGTITGTKVQAVDYGTDSDPVTAAPNPNYDFAGWTGTGFTTSMDNPLTLTNVTSAKTITANFTHTKANLTMATGGSGTGKTTPASGPVNTATPVSIKATPATNNAFTGWTVSGPEAVVADPAAANTNVTLSGDATVTANFAAGVVMTMAKTGNGTVTPLIGNKNVVTGVPVDISAAPATGYNFVNWSATIGAVLGNDLLSSTTATLTANATVTANFAIITNTITSSVNGGNGSITPSDSVNYNASKTFTMTPDANYRVADVLVDGVSVGAVTSYTFANVKSAHTIVASFALAKANLEMVTDPVKGTTTPVAGTSSVNIFTPIAIKATPKAGFAFDYWTVGDGATVANPGSASTKVTLTGAGTVTANYINLWALTTAKTGSGTVTPASGNVLDGFPVAITATPATGYHFVDWTPGGAAVADTSLPGTTATLTSNATVTANFAINTFTIAASAGLNGSITPTADVNYNTSKTFTITPDPGYRVEDVLVDSVSVGAIKTYTFTAVKATHTIDATFALATATLTMANDTHGSTTPIAGGTVVTASPIPIKATPATGYVFDHWDVTGGATVANAALASTTTTLTADGTVTANFAESKYTITSSAGAGGAITPTSLVNYNASKVFTMTPIANYHVADVLVDFVSVGAVKTYNFANVKADHEISATFAINTNTVTFVEGANGTITGTKVQSINYGADCTAVTAVPNDDYEFLNWTGAGFTTTATNPLTVLKVTAAKTITANFKHIQKTLTMANDTHGTTTPAVPTLINTLTPYTIKATPKAGWAFKNWTVSDAAKASLASETSATTSVIITDNVTVTANFIGGSVLTMAKVGNGSTNPAVGTSNVITGTAFDISATPDVGYKFAGWSVSGGATVLEFLNPSTKATLTAAGKVTANFTLITNTITASAGANGTITPSGAIVVNDGLAKSFTIKPNTNYHIAEVLVDGVSIGAPITYNFTNVKEAHTIEASFTINTNTVIFVEGANGTITGPKVQAVDYNGSGTEVTAVPSTDYHFVNWTGTGFVTTNTNPLTVSGVKAPLTITANFAHRKATLTMASAGNGTVTPASGNVDIHTAIPIKAIPKAGYAFDHWEQSDSDVIIADTLAASTTATLNGLRLESTVTAYFLPGSVLTMAKGTGNGTFTPATGPVITGNLIPILATPAGGYHFTNWTVNSGGVTFDFDDPTAASTNVTVASTTAKLTANFAQNTNDLIMTVSPDGAGTATPVSTSGIAAGVAYPLKATPAAGWHFVKWTLLSGSATIANPTAAITTGTLTGGDTDTAELQAEFAHNTTTLTMAVIGNGGISGDISIGTNTVDTITDLTIIASPDAGSHFVNWTSTGGAVVADKTSDATTVRLTGPGTVTANFAIYDYSVVFESADILQGTIVGTTPQTAPFGGSCLPVKAIPLPGYHFVEWTGTGTFLPTSANPLTVIVDQAEDMVITASFARNQGNLTIDHTGTGTTIPASGSVIAVNTNEPQGISATDANFVNWTISGAGMIEDPLAQVTTVTLTGVDGDSSTACNVTATANYLPPALTPATPYNFNSVQFSRTTFTINAGDLTGITRMVVTTSFNGIDTEDCDLYVRPGLVPSIDEYYAKSTNAHTGEYIEVLNPAATNWYIMVYGYKDFNNVDITVTIYSDVPGLPTLLTASQNLPNKVTLSWDASANPAETYGYDIYRAKENSTDLATLIGSIPNGAPTPTTYDDTTALPGTIYYYWVRGNGDFGSSNFSTAAQGSLANGAPLTLANGVAVTVSGDIGTTRRYQISVPAGQSLLEINTTAGTGDCDLSVTKLVDASFLKYGVHVTNSETVNIDDPAADTYIISLYANTAYAGLSLTAKYYLAQPPPPTMVTASDGTYPCAIIVSWKASAGAAGYEVWRSATASSSQAVNIAEVSDISYIDVSNPISNPLSATATYYYFIKAKNAAGTSAYSANNSGYIARIPAAPATVTATKDTYFEKIAVTWSAVAGATSYLIYRNTTGVFNESDLIATENYVSNYTTYTYDDYGDVDPDPNTNIPNQKYYYWVKAKNGSGALNYKGDYGTIRPNGPATITASQGTLAEKIRISWSSVGPEMIISYNLYCDNVLVVPNIPATSYEYPVGALDTGTHEFKVEASFNSYYVSDFSPTCMGYAQNAVILPPAPTLKSVSNGEGNYVDVKWGEVPLALTYNLYRKINAGDPWDVAIMTNIPGSGATVSISDITGVAGQKYLYAVTAVNAIGEGPMSAAMTGYAANSSVEFFKGDPAIALGGAYKSETFFNIFVQPGCSRLVITLTPHLDATGSCDLYTKLGSYPTLTSYNARGVEGMPAGSESITIANPAEGMWYIMLYGASAYNNFDFSAAYYYATDILLTEVPANDQTVPFTATFKGKVQDEALTGIAGLTVGVRNPSTGLTYWIPTKTDANGIFSYSIPVSAEGEYTFDFTLSAIPDYTTSIASYTLKTKRTAGGIFDFAGYIPCETATFGKDFVIDLQEYMNLKNGFADGPPIDPITYGYCEDAWLYHSLVTTSMDPNITAKLDSGLYMLYYGSEGVSVGNCGNEILPENLGFKASPLMVHVAQDSLTDVLNGLKGFGLIDNELAATVEAGGIGVVVIAGLNNPPGEEMGGSNYDISLNAEEQIELLENIAGINPGTVTSFVPADDKKYDEVNTRLLHVRFDGDDRELGVRSSSFFEQYPAP